MLDAMLMGFLSYKNTGSRIQIRRSVKTGSQDLYNRMGAVQGAFCGPGATDPAAGQDVKNTVATLNFC